MLNLQSLTFIRQAGDEKIYRCPFCGDSQNPSKGHLYVNLQKGVYYCHKCHKGGTVKGLQSQEYSPLDCAGRRANTDEYLDEVYSLMLDLLKLEPRHEKDLKRRGLSNTAYYRSLPDSSWERRSVASMLAKQFDLSHVPGFKYDREWTMLSGPGYLIPVRNPEGKIRGFQVRRDPPGLLTCLGTGDIILQVGNEEIPLKCPGRPVFQEGLYVPTLEPGKTVQVKMFRNLPGIKVKGPAVIGRDPKYTWFSWHNQIQVTPHFVPGRGNKIWVTEGVLKADVLNALTGYPVIGFSGTGTWKKFNFEIIRKKTVVVAFDMEDNLITAKERNAFARECRKHNLKTYIARWDPALGKGIDDVLYNAGKSAVNLFPVK